MTKQIRTQKEVDGLKIPEAGEYWRQVDGVKHLGVRVRSNKTKLYIMRFYEDGRQRKHAIGSAIDMPLSEARSQATEFNGKQVAKGRKPKWLENRKATLQELFAENLQELKDTGKSDTYIANWCSFWSNHVPAALKNKQASAVSVKDVDQLLIRIAKDHPTTANRVRGVLSRIYKRAVKYGTVDHDPTLGVYRAKEHPRTRWLTEAEADALTAVLMADFKNEGRTPAYPSNRLSGLEQYRADQNAVSAAAVLMLMYTGARPIEVFKMTWGDVDLTAGRWVKPRETVKQDEEHTVPLLDTAVALLTQLKAKVNTNGPPDSYVFTRVGEPGNRINSVKRYFAKARERAGIDDPSVTPYVLRKTFVSRLMHAGVDVKTVARLSGHKNPATLLKHYAHTDEETAREGLKKAFGGS